MDKFILSCKQWFWSGLELIIFLIIVYALMALVFAGIYIGIAAIWYGMSNPGL